MSGCQVITRIDAATNNSYSYLGVNISIAGATGDLIAAGYTSMIVADCWEVGSSPRNGWAGHPYRDGDLITYEDFSGSCTNCETPDPPPPQGTSYDCVNGGCVPKTTYKTPGKYATLAACQSGCAKDSNCTGECVSIAEIAALQQAANNLQARLCQ
jgi:hypothetical protein